MSREIMTEQDLLESRKNIPAWTKPESTNPIDYKRQQWRKHTIELEQIENQYSGESYYDSLL